MDIRRDQIHVWLDMESQLYNHRAVVYHYPCKDDDAIIMVNIIRFKIVLNYLDFRYMNDLAQIKMRLNWIRWAIYASVVASC